MSTYSKAQASKLKIKTFSYTDNSGAKLVRAYLKENAAKRLGVNVEDVHQSNQITGGTSVDELVEIALHNNTFEYEIRMKQ